MNTKSDKDIVRDSDSGIATISDRDPDSNNIARERERKREAERVRDREKEKEGEKREGEIQGERETDREIEREIETETENTRASERETAIEDNDFSSLVLVQFSLAVLNRIGGKNCETAIVYKDDDSYIVAVSLT
jgi:sRNA-binding protein